MRGVEVREDKGDGSGVDAEGEVKWPKRVEGLRWGSPLSSRELRRAVQVERIRAGEREVEEKEDESGETRSAHSLRAVHSVASRWMRVVGAWAVVGSGGGGRASEQRRVVAWPTQHPSREGPAQRLSGTALAAAAFPRSAQLSSAQLSHSRASQPIIRLHLASDLLPERVHM